MEVVQAEQPVKSSALPREIKFLSKGVRFVLVGHGKDAEIGTITVVTVVVLVGGVASYGFELDRPWIPIERRRSRPGVQVAGAREIRAGLPRAIRHRPGQVLREKVVPGPAAIGAREAQIQRCRLRQIGIQFKTRQEGLVVIDVRASGNDVLDEAVLLVVLINDQSHAQTVADRNIQKTLRVILAVIFVARENLPLELPRWRCSDEVDGATGRVSPIKCALWTAKHFDSLKINLIEPRGLGARFINPIHVHRNAWLGGWIEQVHPHATDGDLGDAYRISREKVRRLKLHSRNVTNASGL